jgi:hypothetical protein
VETPRKWGKLAANPPLQGRKLGVFMPNQPELALSEATATTPGMAKLGHALAGVADVLAELIVSEPESWERLCKEERELVAACVTYWEAWGDTGVPEVTIGHLVFEALHARHPLVFGDEPAGTA